MKIALRKLRTPSAARIPDPSVCELESADVSAVVHVVEVCLFNTADTQQLYEVDGVSPLNLADVFPPNTEVRATWIVFFTTPKQCKSN